MKKSLMDHLKGGDLITNLGNFSVISQIGQGGNAHVFSFKKGDRFYAIKFLPTQDKQKLGRFRDEYFLVAQIPPHKGIARSYHFDSVTFDEATHSFVVMKLYDDTLAKIGPLEGGEEPHRAKIALKIFRDLVLALEHLHKNDIIHRDVKPENIFYDSVADQYVIGDMGIAHFADTSAPREAQTRKGERLANAKYSPADQIDSASAPLAAWDIYALGQVMNWLLQGVLVRGHGRSSYSGSDPSMRALDGFIQRATHNSPEKRFSSVAEVREFFAAGSEPKRDIFERFKDLDVTIRRSIPTIVRSHETTNILEIRRFIDNFASICTPNEFWYIREDAADLHIDTLKMLPDDRVLLNEYEIKVSKLICYKHPGEWRSFFILLASADEPFDMVDFDGNTITRQGMAGWDEDDAVLYDGAYVDPSLVRNGFYEKDGAVLEVDSAKESFRTRKLKPGAFLVVPIGSGPNAVARAVNERFLASVLKHNTLQKDDLDAFFESVLSSVDREVINRL